MVGGHHLAARSKARLHWDDRDAEVFHLAGALTADVISRSGHNSCQVCELLPQTRPTSSTHEQRHCARKGISYVSDFLSSHPILRLMIKADATLQRFCNQQVVCAAVNGQAVVV